MTRKNWPITLAAAFALLLALAGCAGADDPQGIRTQTVSGYELPGGYGNALNHRGNDSIFTALVKKSLPAEKFTWSQPDGAKGSYIYTPIQAVVTSVQKQGASLRLREGQFVTLRVMGGTAGQDRTVSEISAGPELYRAGMTVQVFAQPPFSDPYSGDVQFVPNWTFAQTKDKMSIYNLHQPNISLRAGEAKLLAEEMAAWSRW